MAKKRLRLNVTALDIKHGVKGNMCHCPIARSAKRALKMSYDPVVCERVEHLVTAGYMIGGNGSTFSPVDAEKVTTFIERFDNGKKVKPCVLEFVED